jgi:methylated-DNA-[protein]-cysteine S-methyltransferase
MTTHWTIYESPLGPLALAGPPGRLSGIEFPGHGPALPEAERRPAAFAAAIHQLDEYFAGHRRDFELELDLRGTPFQRAVWDELLEIPYGATVSYTELAGRVGRPDGVRAVGAAVGRTPVPIVVPCHRVVASNGALTGYRGGLERKAALQALERRSAAGPLLRLPEGDLGAGGGREDAAPARRALPGLEHHLRPERAGAVGGLVDVGHLDVGQPEGTLRLPLDDPALDPVA